MELGGKVRESREIIRYVLLILPECYEIVTGEPSKKTSSNIHKHTESRILFFLVCVKKICNKKSHSIKKKKKGISLLVRWLKLHTPNASGPGFDPSSGN